jgi:hypothetical protein
MPDYDFRSLSPHDFELLARDLLQKTLGVRLESFTAGRDAGIDLRYRDDSNHVIVQCKHYAESGFDALARILAAKERTKVEKLSPSRYVLATSVGLTPGQKDKLLGILNPFCQGPGDILGRDDLNNLLTLHPEVERSHFKLWLTSSGVLERVLNAGIFADSATHVDRIRQRLARYVPNPSFDRARTILEKSRFCVIAGIPGIGKTTLAEVLLADLVDRHGFNAFRVAQDLSELRPIKNPRSRQVFYFDDFLGKTALDKLQKNEDQRIIELMEEVSANPNWRFILTTREYILNAATMRYESFAQPKVPIQMCIVNLGDYTRQVRAKILYNHIFFSELPKEYKLALLDGQGYDRILAHRNYNPRVIEYMTAAHHARTVAAPVYLSEFVESLDNPSRIWDHAFRRQISEAARSLLLVLATLDDATIDDLEKAFWSFHRSRKERFGFSSGPNDWTDALRELEGNFVKTTKIGSSFTVDFHSPSVKDFIESYIDSNETDALDLLRNAVFFEQYSALWTGAKGKPFAGITRARAEYLATLSKHFSAPSAATIREVNSFAEVLRLAPRAISNESRAEFFIGVVDAASGTNAEVVDGLLRQLAGFWSSGAADREDLVRLLQKLAKRGLSQADPVFEAAKHCILAAPETDAEFRAAAAFCEQFPDSLLAEDLDILRSRFREYLDDHPLHWDDDPDLLRSVAGDLEYVGERINVSTDPVVQHLVERADELERERAEPEPDDDYDGDWDSSRSAVDDVQGMFDGLAADLRGQSS